jgi:hypothetical protein
MLTARRRDQHPQPAARHLAFMYWPFWAWRAASGQDAHRDDRIAAWAEPADDLQQVGAGQQ